MPTLCCAQWHLSRLLCWKGAMEAIRRLVDISRLAKREKANRHKPVTKPVSSEFCASKSKSGALKMVYYVFKPDFCLVSAEK